jgi:hypothetical protein
MSSVMGLRYKLSIFDYQSVEKGSCKPAAMSQLAAIIVYIYKVMLTSI